MPISMSGEDTTPGGIIGRRMAEMLVMATVLGGGGVAYLGDLPIDVARIQQDLAHLREIQSVKNDQLNARVTVLEDRATNLAARIRSLEAAVPRHLSDAEPPPNGAP